MTSKPRATRSARSLYRWIMSRRMLTSSSDYHYLLLLIKNVCGVAKVSIKKVARRAQTASGRTSRSGGISQTERVRT